MSFTLSKVPGIESCEVPGQPLKYRIHHLNKFDKIFSFYAKHPTNLSDISIVSGR